VPGIIPDSVLEQIRQANDVVEVISSYFPLKRRGAGFWAVCPFHKEKTPSFQANPQKQIWHCFGCGAGGNVFTFVMKYEGLDFPAAVRRLAERAGITLAFADAPGAPDRGLKERLLRLHEEVAAWFHQQLLREPAAAHARDYLAGRGVDAATIKTWQLGWAPEGWDHLLRWAARRQYQTDLLETAGLILRSDRAESRLYDRFRNRLMFPIRDEQGRVIAFSGRILVDAPNQPKYVNSPETPIFQKSRVLFALDRAKRPILDARCAVVCEGQFDTISCHANGLAHVVAPQGTALTDQQARILKRYVDEVVLMFDADEAGQQAAIRSADALLAAGLALRVVTLPGDHDPDSFLRAEGPDRLAALIGAAPGFLTFLLDRLAREHDFASDRGKVAATRTVVEWLQKIPSPVLQATFLRQAAARLEVPESALAAEVRQARSRPRGAPPADPEPPTAAATADGSPAEEWLLRLIITDDRALVPVADRLNPAWLSGSTAAELIRQALQLHQAGSWSGTPSLLNRAPSEAVSRLLSRLLLEPALTSDQHAGAVTDCLGALERQWVQGQWRDLHRQLAQPGLSREKLVSLQQRVLDLRRVLDHSDRLSSLNSTSPQDQA